VNCPHCAKPIELGWQRLKRRRKTKGLCLDCGLPAAPFARCKACRAKIARRVAAKREALATDSTV